MPLAVEFDERPEEEGGLLPEEEASEPVLAAAHRFFSAVTQGDARGMWELFSDSARAYVLNIAIERGMDFDLGSRLRSGEASEEEEREYLEYLLEGIRRDLRGVSFDRLIFESKAEPEAPMQMRVTYLMQMEQGIGDVIPAIPAGSLVLSYDAGEWKVERLIPRPG